MNRPCPRQVVAWAAALSCAMLAAGVQAQTPAAIPGPVAASSVAPSGPLPVSQRTVPAQADPAVSHLPAIVVTGTSMRRIDAETALPVIVLRQADIERSGARTTTELLQQLPVMQGVVHTNSVVGNDTYGYASLSIHDLGDAYTLVLLNGQRVAPFGGQSTLGALSSVDINTIPLSMVERIEVLTDGASALYGADALGGVVNIITRRDDDANEATIGWTLPRGGAREWRAGAFKSVGSMAEAGHNLSLGASFMHRTALQATARDYARDALITFSQHGQRYRLVDVAQYNTAPANGYDYNGHGGNPYLIAHGACPSGQYDIGDGACLYNFARDLDLVPEQRQQSFMASYTSQVGPDGKLEVDALLSRSQVNSHLAPASTTFVIPATSSLYANYLAGLGVDQDPGYADYRFVDLGRRAFKDSSELGDLALRLQGRHHGWDWQGAVKYSVSQQSRRIFNAMGQSAAQSLIAGGVFDPFVLPGQQSSAGMAALRRQAYDGDWIAGRSTLQEWQAQASKDAIKLDGGPLKFAVGANIRRERLSVDPSLFAQGLLSDPAAGTIASNGDGDLRLGDSFPVLPTTASRWLWGAFTEVLAPVTPSWDLGMALRTDHDSLSGDAVTGKASARWKPMRGLLWRASVGTGFRTPTLNQLRSPSQSQGQTGAAYDCTPALQAQATALGAVPCVSGAQTYAVTASGNDQLSPEHSIQGTLGVRFEPFAGHVLGLDLWAVHIRDRIGILTETQAFDDPASFPRSWATVDGAGGRELAYVNRPLNLGTLMSSGLDIEAGVRRPSPWGLVDSQLRVSTVLREDAQDHPGGPWRSSIGDGAQGGATLKWRASWRTSITRSGWTHGLTLRYQSGFEDAPVSVQAVDANGAPQGSTESIRLKVPGQVLWDWQSSWRVNANWQLTAGVVNLFNTKPPLSINGVGPFRSYIVGYDERYFDARGRMLVLEGRLSF